MSYDLKPSPEPVRLSQNSCLSLLCSQLEWDMKLWWPHSEAMIAFLMAFSDTGDPALLQIFNQVAEYTFGHVSAVSLFLRSPVQI